jgi:hypothetical protein
METIQRAIDRVHVKLRAHEEHARRRIAYAVCKDSWDVYQIVSMHFASASQHVDRIVWNSWFHFHSLPAPKTIQVEPSDHAPIVKYLKLVTVAIFDIQAAPPKVLSEVQAPPPPPKYVEQCDPTVVLPSPKIIKKRKAKEEPKQHMNAQKLEIKPMAPQAKQQIKQTVVAPKLFACDFGGCSSVFDAKMDLHKHRHLDHDVAHLVCNVCGHTCYTIASLNQHVARKHKQAAARESPAQKGFLPRLSEHLGTMLDFAVGSGH